MIAARFLPAARLEFLAEVLYYNNVQPELARRFAGAVEDATARALAFPRSGAPTRDNSRRILVKDFPFSIIYREEPAGIVIFAVAHHAQRAYYWQSRTRAR